MRMNRFGKSVAVAAGFVLMSAASALDRAQSAPTGPGQNQNPASHGAQSTRDSPPADDFAGLDYTPDQKAEIDKIHQETESHKAVIAKDDKLTVDQKNAMLLGYTRMEYSLIYRVLTPEQRRQVRRRILAARAGDPTARKKQAPRN